MRLEIFGNTENLEIKMRFLCPQNNGIKPQHNSPFLGTIEGGLKLALGLTVQVSIKKNGTVGSKIWIS